MFGENQCGEFIFYLENKWKRFLHFSCSSDKIPSDCDFSENRLSESRTFLGGADEISFMRVP